MSFVDFYSIPLFSNFFCINQITRWKQKNILSWVCMNIHISPTPKRPSTLNEGHIWMISWNFNNFIWWNELKNIRVLFHKAAVYLTWLGNFFLHDHKKNDKMAADGKKSKNNFCSFIFINEFVKIRYGSISCYPAIITVLLLE